MRENLLTYPTIKIIVQNYRKRIASNVLDQNEARPNEIGECKLDLYLINSETNKKIKIESCYDQNSDEAKKGSEAMKELLNAGTHTLKAKIQAQFK